MILIPNDHFIFKYSKKKKKKQPTKAIIRNFLLAQWITNPAKEVSNKRVGPQGTDRLQARIRYSARTWPISSTAAKIIASRSNPRALPAHGGSSPASIIARNSSAAGYGCMPPAARKSNAA